MVYRHTIRAGDKTMAVRLIATGVDHTYYFHDDHLGSTGALTDETGAVKIQESFDAWGKRRGSAWTGAPSAADLAAITKTTHRGFTSQEELDNLSLVDLNGRVYDPTVARFMSADPVVQAPLDSQSLNRYSYTFDNPLNATDPTGFDACTTGTHIDRPAGVGCEAQTVYRSNGDGGGAQQQSAAGQPGASGSARSPDAGQQSGQVDPSKLPRERTTADQNGATAPVTVSGARQGFGDLGSIVGGLMIPNVMAFEQRGTPGTWLSNAIGFGKSLFNFANGMSSAANPLSGVLDVMGLGTPDLPIDDDQLGGAAGLDILSAGVGFVSLEEGAARAAGTLSRSAAFRLSKELGGIPRSAQPLRTFTERLRDQVGNVRSRVYEYGRGDGSTVTIREHSLGHVEGNLGPHFNVEVRPPGGGPRQPLAGGADNHVFFGQP